MRTLLLVWAVMMCCSGCSTDGQDDERSEADRATDACMKFCDTLPQVCGELAQELMTDEGVDCVAVCVQGDEPAGETQPLPYLECMAAAKSCDDLAKCKQQF